MAAAARLSVKGHQVTIVEQSDRVGGKAGSYERDGFVFDTGPSLITLPAVYRDLFLKTGSSLEDNVDLQPVEPGTRYRWADGTEATLPGVNPAAVAIALGDAHGDSARQDWLALTARAAEIWRANRLVVDTGLHAKGWTREQAIAQMRNTSAISETNATIEVERYIAMPGQALSLIHISEPTRPY